MGSNTWGIQYGFDSYHASTDATLFSSSLPAIRHEKLNTKNSCEFIDNVSSSLSRLQQGLISDDSLEDVETHTIGSLLPDDEDELLSGLTDGFDVIELAKKDELEDYDLFGSVGGMELENDMHENLNMGMISLSDDGMAHYGILNGVGSVAGEHPYGEHPSRTLFVRNINSNVEDSELITLFEQFGDIRTLYTTCKYRGFVMISYYDIRDARTAMRALQNKPLRRRKLDIHFSIPKDNPSEKDINQGTLVVFNLDPSVSNDNIRQIFGVYGEIKEIRETPHKRRHKFIEFFDVRAAEAALRALNKSDIAGKRIKLEHSRPGGARRNLMLQVCRDHEADESQSFRNQVGSSKTNSPPGNRMPINSPIKNCPLQTISKSSAFGDASGNHLPGLASILHPQISKAATISNEDHLFTSTNTFLHSHSLPQPKLRQFSENMPSLEDLEPNSYSIGKTISRSQFLWGSPSLYPDRTNSSSGWPIRATQNHGFHYTAQNSSFPDSPEHFGFLYESPKTILVSPSALRNINLVHNGGNVRMNMNPVHAHRVINVGIAEYENMPKKGSSGIRIVPSSPWFNPIYLANGLYSGQVSLNLEGIADRMRGHGVENNIYQIDSKKQFQLDLDKIVSGVDPRTTLMIKNIPNKYTSKMLLADIDDSNRSTYDFLYLPIDFKNKCNVGYAFINMLSPSHIIPFHEAFDGKRWDKFNSEKVASLAYARIQGKAALVAHFQNLSLMYEDKRCKPILFYPEGSESDDQIF